METKRHTSRSDQAYDVHAVEAAWQARWAEAGIGTLDLDAVPVSKFYNLVEFPYPSAEGLHVGHVYTYCGADVYGRYLRMRGRAVFQPIGFDSFGIHTENYALRVGEHPKGLTARTIANYRRQLARLGAAWDWSRAIATSDPAYYRWTQWIFVQLFRAGLAVRRQAPVVWCPSCLTVLAFEQVEDDRCERCGARVTERVMKQWFLRITAYADELVDGLDELDWPDVAKTLQREWIGRSTGVDVDFAIEGSDVVLSTFTTRVDTIYGVMFIAVSPVHPAAGDLPSGSMALHPLTGERIPVFVADYVVAGFGTGAVMGVPAHDARDHTFAEANGLPVVAVVEPTAGAPIPWEGDGTLTASGPFTGMASTEARVAIAERLEADGLGHRTTRYRLHDWLISRQRYWGPPIPIVHCEGCGEVAVPEEDLPVLLPDIDDFHPTGTGVSPLASDPSFVHTTCPSCGGPATRETDVSDTFFDSSWYFLRFPSTEFDDVPWDAQRTARMLPVDQYAGGREHVVRHHLYARFVTRALHDLGLVPSAEPFPRVRLHGFITLAGSKMSKSRGNVVNPDRYLDEVGADVLRMSLLFCGPWEEGGEFSDAGVAGMQRFLLRAWRLLSEVGGSGAGGVDMRPLDRAVASVERSIERLKFNTAISALMEAVRWARAERAAMSGDEWTRTRETIILLLALFAPHVAEELWARGGGPFPVHGQRWPSFDPAALVEAKVTLVVQVDGKVRDRITVPRGTPRADVLRVVLRREPARRHLGGADPDRVVFIPDRLINLITAASHAAAPPGDGHGQDD
jgi:leucyl-tRNA synthetase